MRAARAIPGLEIAAIYGTNADKVARLSREHGGAPCADLDEFLSHRPMDLVAIGSPSGMHAMHGIAAARTGLHVLVEKPIDIRTERADALIAEAEMAGVKLGVFFQDRLKPGIRRLKEMIDGGTVGNPILVDARVKWYRPPEYYSGSRWRGTWALDGGGALINQGVHTIDLLLWLLGDVERVQARMKTALHAIEAEDTLVAILEFANGAVGTFEATTAAHPGYPRRIEITGSKGTLILEHDQLVGGNEERDQNPSASSPVVSDHRGHQAVLEDFIHAIETDSRPACDGPEGRRSLALVEAIYAATKR